MNANAMTLSPVSTFRCLVGDDVLYNAGVGRALTVVAPEGSIVNARRPAAVAGGNVETSQRITDVVLGALGKALPDRLPAASQGTMNNVTLGGRDPRTGRRFAYYETMGGGMGGRKGLPGLSGAHAHEQYAQHARGRHRTLHARAHCPIPPRGMEAARLREAMGWFASEVLTETSVRFSPSVGAAGPTARRAGSPARADGTR